MKTKHLAFILTAVMVISTISLGVLAVTSNAEPEPTKHPEKDYTELSKLLSDEEMQETLSHFKIKLMEPCGYSIVNRRLINMSRH